MNKETSRVLSVLLIGVLIISLMGIVMAQPDSGQDISPDNGISEVTESIVQGFIDFFEPVFRALLGAKTSGDQWIIQILAFLLVMFVVYGVLGAVNIFGDKDWLKFIIGAIVAILGIRFLPEDLLTQLATPSSAFVAIIVLGIPFILLFFLIKDLPQTARRAVWVVYGVLIIILWVMSVNKPGVSNAAKAVYPIIVIACIVVFLIDGTILRWLNIARREKLVQRETSSQLNRMHGEIRDLESAYASAAKSGDTAKMTEINDQLKGLRRGLKRMKI